MAFGSWGSETKSALSGRWRWLAAAPILLAAVWAAGPFIPVGGRVPTRGPVDQHEIALTFDDGPNPLVTPKVLDILDHYGAKGTFFLVGENVRRHPDTASLIVERGHEVGNHSQSHGNFLPYYLPQFITRDFDRAEAEITDATGLMPRIYRAPHGRVTPWMRVALRVHGVVMIRWDYSPRDWEQVAPDELVRRVTAAARNGGVILMHDGLDLNDSPDRSNTVEALPRIIETLQARGFRLVTVAELFKQEPYAR